MSTGDNLDSWLVCVLVCVCVCKGRVPHSLAESRTVTSTRSFWGVSCPSNLAPPWRLEPHPAWVTSVSPTGVKPLVLKQKWAIQCCQPGDQQLPGSPSTVSHYIQHTLLKQLLCFGSKIQEVRCLLMSYTRSAFLTISIKNSEKYERKCWW